MPQPGILMHPGGLPTQPCNLLSHSIQIAFVHSNKSAHDVPAVVLVHRLCDELRCIALLLHGVCRSNWICIRAKHGFHDCRQCSKVLEDKIAQNVD